MANSTKISEVNNSASAMYILPADKEAAVQTWLLYTARCV